MHLQIRPLDSTVQIECVMSSTGWPWIVHVSNIDWRIGKTESEKNKFVIKHDQNQL